MSTRKKHTPFTYTILGESWEFYVLKDRAYCLKFGTDSAAICLLKEREVWFKESDLDGNTIAHEVMHILFTQATHHSSELTPHQTEEVCAELIGRTWNFWAMWIGDIDRGVRKASR